MPINKQNKKSFLPKDWDFFRDLIKAQALPFDVVDVRGFSNIINVSLTAAANTYVVLNGSQNVDPTQLSYLTYYYGELWINPYLTAGTGGAVLINGGPFINNDSNLVSSKVFNAFNRNVGDADVGSMQDRLYFHDILCSGVYLTIGDLTAILACDIMFSGFEIAVR